MAYLLHVLLQMTLLIEAEFNQKIAQLIQNNDIGDGDLAQKMTQQARNKKSKDNLGIIITKLQ